MSVKSDLLDYQKDIKDLEKQEQKLTGAIETLYDSLRKDIGDISMDDGEAVAEAKRIIMTLKDQLKKAEKQLSGKVELIETMVAEMED